MSGLVNFQVGAPPEVDAGSQRNSNEDEKTKKSMWNTHTAMAMAIGGGILILAIFSGVSIWKYAEKPNGKVWPFSVHAYQGNLRNITLTGPFLGKVRVHATRVEISNDATSNNKQSYCDNPMFTTAPQAIKDACNLMRIPTMYSGNIHSSWSVLGAQSVSVILKNIYLISFVFSSFIFSDFYIRYACEDHKTWTRWIRAFVVFLAVLVSLIAICLDFRERMHTYEDGIQAYAIGSVSTGLFFWIVTLLIICCSQVDEVTSYDWHKHINLNMSFLILLLLPLFMILGLLDREKAVIDVHIQLIFFSAIFFAVLDIFQVRVMPVLEELTVQGGGIKTEDSDKLSSQLHYIKIFVVLACILCKLFVFVPTLEMVGRYYIIDNPSSFSWSMLAFQIALLVSTSVIDLAYIVLWQDKLVHTFLRTSTVWIIIVGSILATWMFPVKS